MQYPDPRYFDYAASCPPFTKSLDRYVEAARTHYANPSSAHQPGRKAFNLLRRYKTEFYDLVNYQDGRLLICSSGTEANNLIIEGHMRRVPGAKLLIAEDVHDSIWYATEKHADSVEILPVGPGGAIDRELFEQKLENKITLACISHVSHELGTIHPVSAIANICSIKNVKLLVDGAQALGHIPVDLSGLFCDYYSFSSHKFGGPRFSGGVFIRDDDFEPQLRGGKQEWGLRPGTENLPGLAASLTALQICHKNMEEEIERLKGLKDYFIRNIRKQVGDLVINSPENGVPALVSLGFPGLKSNEIVTGLSLSGFSVSAGSACQAGETEPSRIIVATGRTYEEALGTIRISMGYGTTHDSVDQLIFAIKDHIENQSRKIH